MLNKRLNKFYFDMNGTVGTIIAKQIERKLIWSFLFCDICFNAIGDESVNISSSHYAEWMVIVVYSNISYNTRFKMTHIKASLFDNTIETRIVLT